jgi:hypothetical protein
MNVLIGSAPCLSLAAHQASNAWPSMRVTRIEMQTTASKHDNDLQLVTAVPEVFDIDLAGALELSGPQIIDKLAANRPSTGARLWPAA